MTLFFSQLRSVLHLIMILQASDFHRQMVYPAIDLREWIWILFEDKKEIFRLNRRQG